MLFVNGSLKISIEHVIVFVNTISYISSEYLFVKF